MIPGTGPSGNAFPYGDTVTRLRPTAAIDPYSGEATDADWTDPDVLDVPGCAFDPGGSSEPAEVGRGSVTTSPTLYAPTEADIRASDRVVVRGRTWQVDGDPALWMHPMTGWAAGLVVNLKGVEG